MDSIGYSKMKLLEYADAFRNLGRLYEAGDGNPLVLQLNETAAMLERICGREHIRREGYNSMKNSLYRYLHGKKLIVEHILVMEHTPGKLQIIMNIALGGRGCMTVKELAAGLSSFLKKELWPAKGCRQVITAEGGEYIFEEAMQYRLIFGRAGCNKGLSYISGDSYSFIDVEGGKSVATLVDGVGAGVTANQLSTRVIELLEQLLEAGFTETAAVNMVNSVFAARDWVGNPAAIDMCSINAYDGSAHFIKMGAASSFIKSKNGTRIITSASLPAGVIENAGFEETNTCLSDGDYVIMVSDGVLDALPFYDKEKKMKEIIEDIDEKIPAKLADRLLNEIFFYDEKVADDMTILVTGVWKR